MMKIIIRADGGAYFAAPYCGLVRRPADAYIYDCNNAADYRHVVEVMDAYGKQRLRFIVQNN